jgi:hypothetical protein
MRLNHILSGYLMHSLYGETASGLGIEGLCHAVLITEETMGDTITSWNILPHALSLYLVDIVNLVVNQEVIV